MGARRVGEDGLNFKLVGSAKTKKKQPLFQFDWEFPKVLGSMQSSIQGGCYAPKYTPRKRTIFEQRAAVGNKCVEGVDVAYSLVKFSAERQLCLALAFLVIVLRIVLTDMSICVL